MGDLLPFGIALLRGWAPRRTRERWSRARIRVHGVSVRVLYVGSLVPPVLRLSGMPRDVADFVLLFASPGLFFLALGLQAGTALRERFARRDPAPVLVAGSKLTPTDQAGDNHREL